jgi:cytochrome c-type biogenesis protein CcmF
MPYFHSILGGLLAALLFILIFVTDPFTQFHVLDLPIDGEGLNPLLQNPLMVIHPPCLLSGFSTFAIPFAFGMAALLAREEGVEWLRATRKWTLISWLFLSVGNILGGMWAYQELGWGGYWAWDPVENAALIPWFMASAYLHSVIIQEQRGMFRKWNAVLVGLTFITTILGTWMTRSGLIESVHTFAESQIGDYFLAILLGSIAFTVYVVASRWRSLTATHHIDSPVSREAAFLFNNWIFVGLGFVVLWGTLFPKLKEMVTGQAIAIGPAWYNKFTAPLGVLLLILMVAGMLLPWRRVTARALRRNFTVPTVATAFVVPIALGTWWITRGQPLGVDPQGKWAALAILAFTFVFYNFITITIEFARGTSARRKATGAGPLAAMFDLVSRHRRRYGGYLVHTGMIFIFLAFTGNVGKVDRDATIRVGESVQLGDYTVRFDGIETINSRDKREVYADMTLSRGGEEIAILRPARFDFNDYSMLAGDQPDPMKITSEIYIRSTPIEDVYVALLQVDEAQQAAAFKLVVLPFTWWFWFGGLVLIAGTLIAMWPEEDRLARQYWRHRVLRRVEGVAVASMLALPFTLFVGQMEAWAQSEEVADQDHDEHDDSSEVILAEDENIDLIHEAFSMVMTTCTGCAGKSLATASPSCYPSNQDKALIREMAGDGMDLDAILAAFVEERGESALAVPPNEGLNRLAWGVPVVGISSGILLILMWTRRWSRDVPLAPGIATATDDDALLVEFDDELAARS